MVAPFLEGVGSYPARRRSPGVGNRQRGLGDDGGQRGGRGTGRDERVREGRGRQGDRDVDCVWRVPLRARRGRRGRLLIPRIPLY